MAGRRRKNPSASSFQLKITLNDIEPEIWRRIVVPSGLNLRELHVVIQGAMGWMDGHLHQFEIDGELYGIPFEDGDEDGFEFKNESEYQLAFLLSKGSKFLYWYDFGDDWYHSIEVEEVDVPLNESNGIFCLGGKMACPPEDCGGPYGYADLLEAIADSKHPEHMNAVDWINDVLPGFDPNSFDVAQANKAIWLLIVLYHEREWGFV